MESRDDQPPDKLNPLLGANPNGSPNQAKTQLLGVTQTKLSGVINEPMNVTEIPSVDLLEKGDAEMSSETEIGTSKEDRNAAAKAQAKRLKAQIEQRAKATPAKSVTSEKASIASRTRLQSRAQTESPIKAPVEMLDLTQESPEKGIEMETIDESLKVQQTRKGASKTQTKQGQSKTRKTVLKSENETLKTKTKTKPKASLERAATPIMAESSKSTHLTPKMGIITMQTETEDSELQEQPVTSEVITTKQEYPELAKEIIFYSQAELNKLADGPINEDSIKMRAPEDHLTYGQLQWQTCYRYNRSLLDR